MIQVFDSLSGATFIFDVCPTEQCQNKSCSIGGVEHQDLGSLNQWTKASQAPGMKNLVLIDQFPTWAPQPNNSDSPTVKRRNIREMILRRMEMMLVMKLM